MQQSTLRIRSKGKLAASLLLAASASLASVFSPLPARGAPEAEPASAPQALAEAEPASAPQALAEAEPASAPQALAEGDAPAPAPTPVEVIFTGFARRSDKGASIFVRMTGEVPVAFEHSGRRLVFRLTGAKLGGKNNANPLPTASFGPPVSNVALVASNGAVDVVIDLTDDPGDKAPAYRVLSQSGMATLVVDLPPPAAE